MPKTELIQVRITPETKSMLEKTAKAKGLTLAAYIRMILISSLQKE